MVHQLALGSLYCSSYQYQYVILSQVSFTSLYCSVRFFLRSQVGFPSMFCSVRFFAQLGCFPSMYCQSVLPGFLISSILVLVCNSQLGGFHQFILLSQVFLRSQVGFPSMFCSVRFFAQLGCFPSIYCQSVLPGFLLSSILVLVCNSQFGSFCQFIFLSQVRCAVRLVYLVCVAQLGLLCSLVGFTRMYCSSMYLQFGWLFSQLVSLVCLAPGVQICLVCG